MLRNASITFSLALALLPLACASTTPVTQWGYSDWFRRGGPGEMGSFERQRDQCLKQAGVTSAASVARNSPEEDRFIACMNAADWCTTVYHCQKPGA